MIFVKTKIHFSSHGDRVASFFMRSLIFLLLFLRVASVSASTDDFVDMSVKVTYGSVNATKNGPYLSNVTIELPDISPASRVGGNVSCGGRYLVDFVKPVPDGSVFFAEKDALGSARSSCAAMNYTRPLDVFSPTRNVSAAVVPGWETTALPETGRRKYYRTAPLSLRRVEKECGGSSDGRTMRWTVHVCRVSYFGDGCRSLLGEYAAFCSETEGVVAVGGKTVVATGSLSFPTDFDEELSGAGAGASGVGGGALLVAVLAYICNSSRASPPRRRSDLDRHER